MIFKKPTIFISLLLSISIALITFETHSEDQMGSKLESAIDIRLEGQKESIESQKEIDQLADQKLSMVQDYQQATIQLGDLQVYNNQLEKLVEKQREKLASFDQQLESAREAQRNIVPMMLKMVKVLSRFIQLDTPFLHEERSMRVTALKEMLDDPTVTTSEKYRRILEAYQIEADYGRTIESYNGEITLGSENRSVEFLRVGRVALIYSSLNGSEAGFWNKNNKQWQLLPVEYNESINHGLRIARKESPPDLIKIPLDLSKVEFSGDPE